MRYKSYPVSILLLWIVLLKVIVRRLGYVGVYSFNPSSLDCTSESVYFSIGGS